MLASLRTYRVLSAFVALTVLFGAGFPLVHHLCGMVGEASAASPAVASTSEGGQHLPGYLPDRWDSHAEKLPAEDAPQHDGCEVPACSMEAAEPLPAVNADHQPSERLLILPAVLLFERLDPVPSIYPLLRAFRGAVEAPAPSTVPLRLLTSTFLL